MKIGSPGRRRFAEALYVTLHYAPLMAKRGLSPEQAVDRCIALTHGLEASGMLRRSIRVNGLDNPYMTELARQVLINDVLREIARKGQAAPAKEDRSVKPKTRSQGDCLKAFDYLHGAGAHLQRQFDWKMTREVAQAHFDARVILARLEMDALQEGEGLARARTER